MKSQGMWESKLQIVHDLYEDLQIILESGIPNLRVYVVCLHFQLKDQAGGNWEVISPTVSIRPGDDSSSVSPVQQNLAP